MTSTNSTSIAEYFRYQANWRDAKSVQCPDDERNVQSARALRSLAEYVDSGEAETRDRWIIQALDAHLFEEFTFAGEEAQREVSRYGYGYGATNDHQHQAFLSELWVTCMQDAYDFVRSGAAPDDPSESLFAFEVDAARDGVHLPSRYWQLRSGTAEPELEEAVGSYRGDGEAV